MIAFIIINVHQNIEMQCLLEKEEKKYQATGIMD